MSKKLRLYLKDPDGFDGFREEVVKEYGQETWDNLSKELLQYGENIVLEYDSMYNTFHVVRNKEIRNG